MPELSENSAFYAGSFDPPTNGHMDILYKTVQAFDQVVVAAGHNPAKKEFFPMATRLDLIRQSIAQNNWTQAEKDRIIVTSYSNIYLVGAAVAHGCGTIVRGIRNSRDEAEENLLITINKNICDDLGLPQLQTRLFSAGTDTNCISSSMVKSMLGFDGWEKAVARYVPPAVLRQLITTQE